MMPTATRTLTARQLYLYDTQGFVVVPGVFDAAEVAELTAPLDPETATLWQDFSNAHRWNHLTRLHPVFARLAGDPRLADLAFDVINQPMRLLESYALRYGAGGSLFMHAGNAHDIEYPDGTRTTRHMAYRCEYHDGRLYTTMVKTLVYLTDITSDDEGAFVYVHGSHKANFAFPWAEVAAGRDRKLADTGFPGLGRLLPRAGDVVLLNEALCHGAARTNKTRYLLSFLYAPAFMPDFERIIPRRGDLQTQGFYDADYEPSGMGFVAGCEKPGTLDD